MGAAPARRALAAASAAPPRWPGIPARSLPSRETPSRSWERTWKPFRSSGHGAAHASRVAASLPARLVEPHRDDLAALVTDPRVDDRQVSPRSPHRDRPHLACDRRLLPRSRSAIGRSGDRLLVAVRPVLEQVADPAQPELRKLLLQRRPDAGERGHGPLRALGSGSPAAAEASSWARPLRRSLGAPGQSRKRRGYSTSSNQKNPTVPGPACAPTTGPSVVTSSSSAAGRVRSHQLRKRAAPARERRRVRSRPAGSARPGSRS